MTNRLTALIHLLVVLSLAFPWVGFTSPLPALAQPASAESASSGLLRAHLSLPNQTSLQRLQGAGVRVLRQGGGWAQVIASEAQLEQFVRLGFQPQAVDEMGALVAGNAQEKPWLASSLAASLSQAAGANARLEALEKSGLMLAGESLDGEALAAVQELQAILSSFSIDQVEAISTLFSLDDDADGLTNTQEAWWCTDPLDQDSDNDGANDGAEVQAAKSWLGNQAASYPASGKPFVGWPPDHAGCYDDDLDSIPDQAERWELGLNMNLESTDRDKFDDGQELFGSTYCPGSGGYCGYGVLPRNEDWGVIFAQMPSWVKAPGRHPLAAAFPSISIDVIPSSLNVQSVSTITTDHTITSGTTKSYSTAKTDGASTSVSDTETWNTWEESSTSIQQPLFSNLNLEQSASISEENPINQLGSWMKRKFNYIRADLKASLGCLEIEDSFSLDVKPGGVGVGAEVGLKGNSKYWDSRCRGAMKDARQISTEWANDFPDEVNAQQNTMVQPVILELRNDQIRNGQGIQNLTYDLENIVGGLNGVQYNIMQTGQLISQRLYDVVSYMRAPTRIDTNTQGKSFGGARTTTSEQYQEHTVTNGEAFSSEESWGTATAVDSAHAADLRFTYKVRNDGAEYAREICNLAFNVYIGDDPNPAYTYSVASQIGGTGCYSNFMPAEEHTYTANPIPLSLEQMKTIDLFGKLRVVVEDYSYGIDELFYQDAANAGVLLAVEDGTADGNEAIDTFLVPTWGTEYVSDVLGRFFPHEVDVDGNLIAIWTPENRADAPAWCAEPRIYGLGLQAVTWCKHALSTADWWNIYTNNLGDGSLPLQETLAVPGGVALLRFNQDSDLDGYSDRSERKLGTDPADAASHPRPELLAGMHSIQNGSYVTATLSLLNTGLYDAYGVEAVMVAPDDSITIENNTVGGSGRVRAQKSVVVGSRILPPQYSALTWTGSAQPGVSGYFVGTQDITYTLTVSCAVPEGCLVGSGAWALNWSNSLGGNGTLDYSLGYQSPSPLALGASGVQLALRSGTVFNGNTFQVLARTPRDTFQYTVNRTPHAEPVVIVSYNDPQGNHRFILPSEAMSLASPGQDLAPFAGGMLQDVGVEIVTAQPAASGANTTGLVINNPISTTFANSHLFLEFVDITGTVAAEVPVTTTLYAGPNVIPVDWDTGVFSPTYDAAQDYIVMAFWTDWQGNILDTAARPLSSFQDDPRPGFATDEADLSWNFGAARQGTLLQRRFELASVGYMDLLTYIGSAPGISLEGPASAPLSPSDLGIYTMTINTEYLATGEFTRTIPIRTSDPLNPTREVSIQGIIEPYTPDGTQSMLLRPLDYKITVPAPQTKGSWYNFTQPLLPDPQSIHPMGFTPFGGQIVKGNSDGRPRIGSVTDSPRPSAV